MAHHAATLCFDSPVGRVEVEASGRGVTRIRLNGAGTLRAVGAGDALAMAQHARAEIEAYLVGEREEFSVPVMASGTAFQRSVWQELREIPYGQTRSYSQIASRLGRPRAARAVGAACRANPVPILVPCHRVLAASGGLVGFQAGLAVKQRLLALESAVRGVKNPRASDSV